MPQVLEGFVTEITELSIEEIVCEVLTFFVVLQIRSEPGMRCLTCALLATASTRFEKYHRCRKSKTYQLLTLIPNVSNFNSHNLVVQKYELATETHKMTMFFVKGLCNSLLYKARIAHENTYDMREKYS